VAAGVISTHGMCFRHGQKIILQDIDFDIGIGEIVALLGPNGAGKTTCLRLLSGYMPASSGRITLAGSILTADATRLRHHIGYVPEQAPLHDSLSAHEHLQLAYDCHGLPKQTLPDLLAAFDLTGVQHQPVCTLSKGYRRRVALAMAFAARPAALLLDEPGDGLDPNQKQDLANILHRAANHAAILFSTHQLSDVERLCTRVLLLHQGRICFDGTPAALRSLTPQNNLDAAFAALTRPAA
jgi:ABC-2 type transport system ATP-binding protein